MESGYSVKYGLSPQAKDIFYRPNTDTVLLAVGAVVEEVLLVSGAIVEAVLPVSGAVVEAVLLVAGAFSIT